MSIVYDILIGPLELIFDMLFTLCYRISDNVIISLIGLSLAVSFATLPLYNRAEFYQDAERKKQRSMKEWLDRIHATFSGEERYLVTQAYYREQHYKPIHSLKNSLSLFLQIPFFIAAYNFLSGISSFKGDYGLFAGSDGLLEINGLKINILPVIMTLINIAAGIIYSKGFTWKEKWQIFVLPVVFLVLLYNSKAGLVLYWTFNNVFSLGKNIVNKSKKKEKIEKYVGAAVLGALGLVFVAVVMETIMRAVGFAGKEGIVSVSVMLSVVLFACFILLCRKIGAAIAKSGAAGNDSQTGSGFASVLVPELILTIFLGVFVPSNVIGSSATEFIKTGMGEYFSLTGYALAISAGLMLVWTNIIYGMMTDEKRRVLSFVLFAVVFISLTDYFVLKMDYGILNTMVQYESNILPGFAFIIGSLIILPLMVALAAFLWLRLNGFVTVACRMLLVALAVISTVNIVGIKNDIDDYRRQVAQTAADDKPFVLSENGKNVVVIMLDKAIGACIPFIMEEKPELKEKYDGFTFYPNSVSFGGYTLLGAPALYGGYEYTPKKLYDRADETMAEKHMESLRVMPDIFYENGWDVTLSDLAFAGYTISSDMTMFDYNPDIKAYNVMSGFIGTGSNSVGAVTQKNLFLYGILKSSPVYAQNYIYDNGFYLSMNSNAVAELDWVNYNYLRSLPELTDAADDAGDRLIMFQNELPHNPAILQLPDYDMETMVDNSDYDDYSDRVVDGMTMKLGNENQIGTYHVNMAAILYLGDWLDRLRELGVYDNTRIIIVSDHGWGYGQFDKLLISDELDAARYNCLLMVKDFDSTGFTVSDEFMTNADTPTLAMEGLIANPVNPFSGNKIDSSAKTEETIEIASKRVIHEIEGNRYNLTDKPWYSVRDDIFAPENWQRIR